MQLQNMLRLRMAWAAPSGPHHDVVLSSRVRLARNVKSHLFTSLASPKTLATILEEAFEACRGTKSLAKAAYLNLDELEPVERTFLTERRLINQTLAAQPEYRGIVIGDKEALSCMVNEEDHLRLQAVDSGLQLKELWMKADSLDNDLSTRLHFAFDPRWGYLTACPTNTGTGLRVSALLHLPGLTLTRQINGILEGLSRLGMTARGLYGEGTRVLGDFFQISNATSLGPSEAEFVADIGRTVEKLVVKETETRKSLASGSQKLRLEDIVYRAIGILSHARSISYEETLQHLSHVRLALSLGWKTPIDFETINELLVLAQPAHIQLEAGKELEAPERDARRADLLRQKFVRKIP